MGREKKVRRILILFVFVISINLVKANISIGLGINTSHYKLSLANSGTNFDYNENNKLVSLGYTFKEHHRLSFLMFNNSFFNDSKGINYSYIKDKDNKGFFGVFSVGLCDGYDETNYLYNYNKEKIYFDNWTYLGGGLTGVIGAGIGYHLKKDISLETNVFGNAFVSNIVVKF